MVNEGRPVGVVTALKTLRQAKTRLDLIPPLRERLALCMFLDTVTALAAVADHTVVVSDQPGLQHQLDRSGIDASVIPEDRSAIPDVGQADGRDGLNPAFRHGEQWLRGAGAGRILACVGDLPCLSPAAVRTVLAGFDAAGAPRAFVPDAAGSGTTMLLTADRALDPRFQGASAAAHGSSGASALPTDPGQDTLEEWRRARRDVDTEPDLRSAITLGLGAWTSTLIDPLTGTLGQYETITVSGRPNDSGNLPVVTGDGEPRTLAPGALTRATAGDFSTGQRFHAVRSGRRILSAW